MSINTSPKYSGEPTTQSVASGLASLGRYGDNYMVHAAEGETMIPKEVFDKNPGLKQDLFRQMSMMGIKDPNRYVVGHELNSINPDTGQPEFFFKKIFRAFKKVLKQVAPIAAPIIGNMIAPGIGGIIASGLVTKLQGGSWGDALKSAGLSYGVGALTSGIGGALGYGPSGTGGIGSFGGAGTGFLGGLSRGLTTPFQAAGNLFSSGAQNPLAQGIFGPRGTGTFFSQSVDPAGRFAQGDVGMFPSYKSGEALAGSGIDPVTGRYDYLKDPSASGFDPLRAGDTQNFRRVSAQGQDVFVKNPQTGQTMHFTADQAGQLRDVGALTTDGSGSNVLAPDYQAKMSAAVRSAGPATGGTSKLPPGIRQEGDRLFFGNQEVTRSVPEGFKAVAKPEGTFLGYKFPGSETLGKAAGQLAVPAALAGAVYLLTPEEETAADQIKALNANNPRRVAYDNWLAIDDKNSEEAIALKNQWYGASQYSAAELSSKFGANRLSGITSPIPGITSLAALGGEITGPGTGTSDSIPARLSDGEFVMTAQAVRNAGNGDRDVGAARMYDMMNRFERGVA